MAVGPAVITSDGIHTGEYISRVHLCVQTETIVPHSCCLAPARTRFLPALARFPFRLFPSLLQPLGPRQNGLNAEHMGDLILVIGCTLVISWVAAAFLDCSGAAEALKFPWSKGLVRKG